MKTLFFIGLACVVLGLLSFLIGIPHAQQPSMQTGTINLGVSRTETRQFPGSVSGIVIALGMGMMVAGCRERTCAKEQEQEEEETDDEITTANPRR